MEQAVRHCHRVTVFTYSDYSMTKCAPRVTTHKTLPAAIKANLPNHRSNRLMARLVATQPLDHPDTSRPEEPSLDPGQTRFCLYTRRAGLR